MKLKASLIKKFTEHLDQEYGCIYDGTKTRIYEYRHKVIVVTKERPKYEYYKYALERKYNHVPKIYDLIEDPVNEIYIIKREELFPIVSHKKLVRLEIIQNALKNKISLKDKLSSEPMQFLYNQMNYKKYYNFDFSPHCFMETKAGKIVVSDIFMEKI